jgi:hypothetical protein
MPMPPWINNDPFFIPLSAAASSSLRPKNRSGFAAISVGVNGFVSIYRFGYVPESGQIRQKESVAAAQGETTLLTKEVYQQVYPRTVCENSTSR